MARTSAGASDYDFIFKLVLIGDSSVGKSNLLLRFTRNEFRLDTQSTIGVEFAYKQLAIDGKKIKTQVWDTAGQERFKTVIPQFYRGSEGALAVFDLTKPDSFDHITTWIEEVHRHTPADLPIVLVGNKSDLIDQRKISREQATSLAEQLNLSYMETSALNASNVEQAFVLLVTSIYQKKMPKQMDSSSTTAKSSSETVSMDYSQAATVPVASDQTIMFDRPIRPSNNEKASSKKNGCCVIS
ncbi:unnamed protein product [Rotaria sp. Silwood2]|nr:unnamed protein product [Rotaria sp. Silwood2]CAF2527248.1 unnamed protein product [Rotaria sp. Silwood2]CAF2784059.1 unnamed protein product [Rotaria sp. Silwood2]CAF2936773.1 unnamed protein product [Rotaria sp. Silwood2]CAF3870867.1 unnamed protein product [Rotaria sp. Silwood2]